MFLNNYNTLNNFLILVLIFLVLNLTFVSTFKAVLSKNNSFFCSHCHQVCDDVTSNVVTSNVTRVTMGTEEIVILADIYQFINLKNVS